jgi:hypothetical protein
VYETIRQFKPHVVVFDNAGRTRQLQAARALGARVVFISSRVRQRRKAFRLRWMRLIDEHWVAYPEFVAGALGPLERLKLRVMGRPVQRFLDVILARGKGKVDLPGSPYVLFIPGGGTGHPGVNDAARRFFEAARIVRDAGTLAVFAGPLQDAPSSAGAEGVRQIGTVAQADLWQWMQGARVIVANGGATLLQAIASGGACVAVPIAQDQALRIERCVGAKAAVAASLDTADMALAASRLLRDEASRQSLAQRAAQLKLTNGVEVAVQALSRLLREAGAGHA